MTVMSLCPRVLQSVSHASQNLYVYSSSATHWANAAFKNRLLFSEEHEIGGTGADVTRKAKT